MLVLDTDHLSILGFPSEAGVALLERLGASGEEVATTIITVEEQLRGWLAEIHRLADAHRQIPAYEPFQGFDLRRTIQEMSVRLRWVWFQHLAFKILASE